MIGGPAAGAGALGVLARIRQSRPAPAAYERCEMCAAPIADAHQHVVNISSRALLCTCRPCYLLFTAEDAEINYRAVSDRTLSFPALAPQVWADLELPVGTAFLFHNSALDRIVAFYPGPAGATESELSLQAWEAVVASCPALATLRPDIEALLVHAEGHRVEAFLVPIDRCYELVGRLRALWRGFDGGQEVRQALTDFFDDVRARGRPVDAMGQRA